MKQILVTGANGQLGQSLRQKSSIYPDMNFVFCAKEDFNLERPQQMEKILDLHQIKVVINAAAYTAVDQAEKEPDRAFSINTLGADRLAGLCAKRDIVLAHISTDYVFDGSAKEPYTEEHRAAPLGIYGQSKHQGEMAVAQNTSNHYIIRASWLYGPFGYNFLKTMLRLASEGQALNISTDQTGSPTSTLDLAEAILELVSRHAPYGTYHFSNSGQTTWYGFAHEIFVQTHQIEQVQLAETTDYPTFAKRPAYSVMDTDKITQTLNNLFGLGKMLWPM